MKVYGIGTRTKHYIGKVIWSVSLPSLVGPTNWWKALKIELNLYGHLVFHVQFYKYDKSLEQY